MAAQYDDEKSIRNFRNACEGEGTLQELTNLAKLIQNPRREAFKCDFFPPVHSAARFNNISAIKMLIVILKFKVDSYVNSSCGSWSNATPIHFAVLYQHVEAFKALLEFNPDITLLEKEVRIDSTTGSVSGMIERTDEDKRCFFREAYQTYLAKPKMNEEDLQLSWEGNFQSFIYKVNQVVTMPTENKKEKNALDNIEIGFRELNFSSDFIVEYRSIKNKLQKAKKVNKAILAFESCIASAMSEIDYLKLIEDYQSPEEIVDLEQRLSEMNPKKLVSLDEDILPDDCPVCYAIPDVGREISMCTNCCGKCCTLCFNRVATCPLCRTSLSEFKPIRSRDTEKIVAYYWKNK